MLLIALFSFLLILLVDGQNLEKSRSVWVEQGLVRGKIYKLDNDRSVQIYRGIPYAEPPVGDMRFRKPVRKTRWEKEYSATEYGAPCIQFMDFHRNDRFSGPNMPQESEDCLFLNIFSPYASFLNAEDESHSYPVIVWIHGGSFLAGSGDTGIDMHARVRPFCPFIHSFRETTARNVVFRGITLVTLNYRLGPFGFMSINHGERLEGNFGLYDQKLALEWVARNIKQFNGDPSKVTVMGESAGAAAASVLGLSPNLHGLVHQVIALSGSSTAGWAIHRHGLNPWDMTNIADFMRCNKLISQQDLTAILNREAPSLKHVEREHCNLLDSVPDCLINGGTMNTEEMLTCFRSVNFSSPLFRYALSGELGVSKMVVDGELIPSSGAEFVREYAHLPILTGVATREWAHKKPEFYELYRFENLSRPAVEGAVRKLIETSYAARLPYKITNATINLIANATFLRYMQDVDFFYDMPGVVSRLQDLESDIEFVSPCQTEVEMYAANGLDTFVYSFDYMPKGTLVEEEKRYFEIFGDNPVTIVRKESSTEGYETSPFHGLDHAYIFSQGYSSNFHVRPFSKRDRAMSKMLCTMVTNFAKTGDPSTDNFQWPSYSNETEHYVSLDLPPRLIKGQLQFSATSFWNHEAEMLSQYTLADSPLSKEEVSDLTAEERLQLSAYRRAWTALWLFVIFVALFIWTFICCFVFQKGRSPTSKPFDNLVLNR
ncbi:Hydrolase [Aphelenchoides fujianensis]|nr:Hydrolase [Aphelenchoides fujianensis]